MAFTISPTVSRTLAEWFRSVLAFALGVFAGSLCTYVLARGIVAVLIQGSRVTVLVLLAGVAALGIARDAGLAVPVPYRRAQVPATWRNVLPLEATALAYGWMLGTGFLTLYTYAAHLALVVGLTVLISTPTALAAMAIYAGARTVGLLAGTSAERVDQLPQRFTAASSHMLALRGANMVAAGMIVLLVVGRAL